MTSLWHSNTDGQQPSFNRDAIAEFEVIPNRFDATQGRSQGMVVNAITKSGTNTFAGTFSGYFRDDSFNAKDFIEDRVFPYSNQQVSATYGGPIVRDRIHFFGSYGHEREPQTYAYNSPYPSFNIDQQFTGRVHQILGRLDYQFTPRMRLSVCSSLHKDLFYQGGGDIVHPAGNGTRRQLAPLYVGTFTQVLSNRTVNEIRVGGASFHQENQPNARWKGAPFPYRPSLLGTSVTVQLRGYTIGGNTIDVLQRTQSRCCATSWGAGCRMTGGSATT